MDITYSPRWLFRAELVAVDIPERLDDTREQCLCKFSFPTRCYKPKCPNKALWCVTGFINSVPRKAAKCTLVMYILDNT